MVCMMGWTELGGFAVVVEMEGNFMRIYFMSEFNGGRTACSTFSGP